MSDAGLSRFLAAPAAVPALHAAPGLPGGAQSAAPSTPDPDPQETAEWREAFQALVQQHGPERARFVLDQLAFLARDPRIGWSPELVTPYVNTIPAERQPPFPGDLALEEKLASLMRWNALAMVVRANAAHGDLGGHIASYASAADLFEVGFNHFFRARGNAGQGGDLVFFQPHSAPGVYARAFLEGRLSEADLAHYRQEITGPRQGARGLSSYPHPWLMPDFWQFPPGPWAWGPSARYTTRGSCATSRTAGCWTAPGARSGACSATARWTSPRA
jgi:pyruvate dehydrogenase E1 component